MIKKESEEAATGKNNLTYKGSTINQAIDDFSVETLWDREEQNDTFSVEM